MTSLNVAIAEFMQTVHRYRYVFQTNGNEAEPSCILKTATAIDSGEYSLLEAHIEKCGYVLTTKSCKTFPGFDFEYVYVLALDPISTARGRNRWVFVFVVLLLVLSLISIVIQLCRIIDIGPFVNKLNIL